MTRRVIQSGILITMPEWQADALVLSTRPHGEGSVVVTVLTADASSPKLLQTLIAHCMSPSGSAVS